MVEVDAMVQFEEETPKRGGYMEKAYKVTEVVGPLNKINWQQAQDRTTILAEFTELKKILLLLFQKG